MDAMDSFEDTMSSGKTYESVGIPGKSSASESMQKKGLKQFEFFLKEKNMPSWEELTTNCITIELIQEFGGYLCFEAEKADGELFA